MALKTKAAPRPKVPVKTSKGTSKGPSKGTSKPAAAQSGGKFDDTNRGVLFQNDKQGNEARPDFTGKINVDGVDKRIAAWTKASEKVEGGNYLSIVVSDLQAE